jgi:hypothetical protein
VAAGVFALDGRKRLRNLARGSTPSLDVLASDTQHGDEGSTTGYKPAATENRLFEMSLVTL